MKDGIAIEFICPSCGVVNSWRWREGNKVIGQVRCKNQGVCERTFNLEVQIEPAVPIAEAAALID